MLKPKADVTNADAYKAKGDTVEWWQQDKVYDMVYLSKIFDLPKKTRI